MMTEDEFLKAFEDFLGGKKEKEKEIIQYLEENSTPAPPLLDSRRDHQKYISSYRRMVEKLGVMLNFKDSVPNADQLIEATERCLDIVIEDALKYNDLAQR